VTWAAALLTASGDRESAILRRTLTDERKGRQRSGRRTSNQCRSEFAIVFDVPRSVRELVHPLVNMFVSGERVELLDAGAFHIVLGDTFAGSSIDGKVDLFEYIAIRVDNPVWDRHPEVVLVSMTGDPQPTTFLDHFGLRADQNRDLSRPRWRTARRERSGETNRGRMTLKQAKETPSKVEQMSERNFPRSAALRARRG